METLAIKTLEEKKGFIWKLSTLALCWALAFWNISCSKTTQEDVNKQQEKVESISFQVSHYINARKQLVKDYNTLLRYPRTETNKSDINKSLAQIYEVITDYDKKIENLAKDRIEAIDDLNSYISNVERSYTPNEPLDPNRWDFLLTIQ